VQILFQRGAFTAEDTDRVASTLVGFVVGLTPMAFGFIVSRAFVALGKTKVLLGVSLFSVMANAVFDYLFARIWQSTGIALSTSAVYFCTMFILLFTLNRMIGKLNLLTPPPELLQMIEKLAIGASFSIPHRLRRRITRGSIILATFAVGIVGVFWNSLYTLRAALGMLILLALLRYRYALLIAWVLVDVFIGSTLPYFNGNNLNTGLTIPTLLLMTCMPITQTFKRMPALAMLLLFLLWAFAGIAISPVGVGPFLTQWTLMLDCVAVAVLAINVLTTRRRLLTLIDVFLIPATFVSLYGIYGFFTRQNGVQDPTTSLFRIFSIFTAAPALALFLSIMIPPAIYRASTLRGIGRLGVSILVLIFLAATALSFTRGALICIPLSIVIMMLFLPSRKAKIGLLVAGLLLAVGAVFLPTLGGIAIFSRFFNQDLATLNGRTELWQAVFSHFDPTQLLGNGLGASDALLARLHVGYVGVIATSSSNLFVAALFDVGIIGATLLTLMFISLGAGLLSGMRKATGDRRVLFVMALVVLVNTVVQSLDQNDFWDQSIGIYFWIVMALPFALCWSATQWPSRTAQEPVYEAVEPEVEALQRAKQEQVARL
jgi:O-antigen ligase